MSAQYYVRWRGRVTGPFDLEHLQKLARRGIVSRMHEISSDRANWLVAGDVEELFSGGKPPEAAISPISEESAHRAASSGAQAVRPPEAAAAEPSVCRYYYSQGGSTVGPVPLGVLRSLAQNGTLGPNDMVWQEGSSVAIPAYQVSHLASIYSASTTGCAGSPVASPSSPLPDPAVLRRTLPSIAKASMIAGVVIGGVILFCLNLPLWVVDGRPIWCWNAVREPGLLGFFVMCLVLLFAGLTLCIASPLMKGVPRGVLFLVISGAGGLIVLIGLAATESPAMVVLAAFIVYLVMSAAAMLVALCRFRRAFPGAPAGTSCQLACAITLVVAGATVLILTIGDTAYVSALPGIAVISGIIRALGYLSALAAGIVGIITASRPFSQSVNRAAAVCAASSVSAIIVAEVLFCVGLPSYYVRTIAHAAGLADVLWLGAQEMIGAIVFASIRVLLVLTGMACLAGFGVLETLGALQARRAPISPTPRPAAPQVANRPASALSRITT